jgi:uncharacterized membrane protein YphA (DoxX/SURF4 family)
MPGTVILLLAAIFLLAAISKIRERIAFASLLRRLLPGWLVQPAATLTPAGELLLATFLLSGVAPRRVLAAAIVLLAGFTIILAQMWRRGFKGCGCFGEGQNAVTPGNGLVRNLVLMAATAWAISQTGSFSVFGPDLSSFLGRLTVVAGVISLWPCLVALAHRRRFIFSFDTIKL